VKPITTSTARSSVGVRVYISRFTYPPRNCNKLKLFSLPVLHYRKVSREEPGRPGSNCDKGEPNSPREFPAASSRIAAASAVGSWPPDARNLRVLTEWRARKAVELTAAGGPLFERQFGLRIERPAVTGPPTLAAAVSSGRRALKAKKRDKRNACPSLHKDLQPGGEPPP
jgi:hypothetical protein